MRRLVCLVYPTGCSESELLAGAGSLSIIASEQYLLMKSHIHRYEVVLYRDELTPRRDDILCVMNCLPLVDKARLGKFPRAVYFFDDMNIYKSAEEGYADRLPYISAVFHPVPGVARSFAGKLGMPSYFVPWSLARIPQHAAAKPVKPSFFVDVDGRETCRESLPRAIAFVRALAGYPWRFTIPEPFLAQMPQDLRSRVESCPHQPHDEFLRFLARQWFYVSGIAGSYEFPAMEASYMGCGLISLSGALNDAHSGGPHFLNFDGEPGFAARMQAAVRDFDAPAVAAVARERYPQDGPARICDILDALFPSDVAASN